MAALLEKQTRLYGASDQALEAIARLKQPDAVCVFAGQQAGLFSGPFLVVLKALAIAKAAAIWREIDPGGADAVAKNGLEFLRSNT